MLLIIKVRLSTLFVVMYLIWSSFSKSFVSTKSSASTAIITAQESCLYGNKAAAILGLKYTGALLLRSIQHCEERGLAVSPEVKFTLLTHHLSLNYTVHLKLLYELKITAMRNNIISITFILMPKWKQTVNFKLWFKEHDINVKKKETLLAESQWPCDKNMKN